MKYALILVFSLLFPALALSQEPAPEAMPGLIQPAGDTELSEFLWEKRPLVIFADSRADPAFGQQMDLLTQRLDELAIRDVVILVDTDPAAKSPLRQELRPRGFMMVLIAKDGAVMLRKPFPWSVREIVRTIDKMPIRQRELRERPLEG